ncbi:hypothetical protein [Microbispora hainanensis]|uniref:hypothetical protein n=1 Tax=Microbispora hainanensis TaxID=568844 RepID=UPI0033F89F88
MNGNRKVACGDGGHTDEIAYEYAPEGRWAITRHYGTWKSASRTPQHELRCRRHDAPLYIRVADAEAGILLEGIPLLEHPEYLAALERQDREMAELPVLPCTRSVEATGDGKAMVDGVVIPRGRYRLDVEDGLPHVLIAP